MGKARKTRRLRSSKSKSTKNAADDVPTAGTEVERVESSNSDSESKANKPDNRDDSHSESEHEGDNEYSDNEGDPIRAEPEYVDNGGDARRADPHPETVNEGDPGRVDPDLFGRFGVLLNEGGADTVAPGLNPLNSLTKELGALTSAFHCVHHEMKTQTKVLSDLFHQSTHEQRASMGRVVTALARNHNELKERKEMKRLEEAVVEAITQGQVDQRRIIRDTTEMIKRGLDETQRMQSEQLQTQTTLIAELSSKTLNPAKDIRTEHSRLLSEMSAMQAQNNAVVIESMEKALFQNTQAMGKVISKVCTEVIQSSKNSESKTKADENSGPVASQSLPKQVKNHSDSLIHCTKENAVDPKSDLSDSDINDDGKSSASHSTSNASSTNKSRTHKRPKLSPFTGSEPWEIWYNRFSDVATRYGWGDSERLDELLPRLEGKAGEFVYGQLPEQVRAKYPKLIAELNSRFRKIESTKTYAKKFSNRRQKTGESPETYCADLKRLYDKAYPSRTQAVREEDLVRRFFDGLQDPTAKIQIEFFKSPDTVDEAVSLVVNYDETCQRFTTSGHGKNSSKQHPRVDGNVVVVSDSDDSDTPDQDSARITRANSQGHSTKSDFVKHPKPSVVSSPKTRETTGLSEATVIELVRKTMSAELEKHSKSQKSADSDQRSNQDRRGYQNANKKNNQYKPKDCWKCGIPGHIAAYCEAYHQMIAQQPTTPPNPQPQSPDGQVGNTTTCNHNQQGKC